MSVQHQPAARHAGAPRPPLKASTVYVRLTDAQIALVDKLAADIHDSRSVAVRFALRSGLAALGIRSTE